MGLRCSHNAFCGSYAAFNRLRQFVAAATGGIFPPHTEPELPPDWYACGDDYPRSAWPGLHAFLAHSDCEGELSPATCAAVADDLERLLPRMEALQWESRGHIAARGGFLAVVRAFIGGCRAAAAAGEPLTFG